jgi:hypothetical protein
VAGVLALGLAGFAGSVVTAQPSHQGRRDRQDHRDRQNHQGQDQTPLKLTAFAVNLAAERPAASANIVEIQIERWSRDDERAGLIDSFHRGGENTLLAMLQKTPRVGYIRTPDHVSWDLHYAREADTEDGGHRIFIATDRPIRFWESANLTRSTHYPFTLIEIHLDPSGHGEGRLSIATKVTISPDSQHIELENYSTQPVLLEKVARQQNR